MIRQSNVYDIQSAALAWLVNDCYISDMSCDVPVVGDYALVERHLVTDRISVSTYGDLHHVTSWLARMLFSDWDMGRTCYEYEVWHIVPDVSAVVVSYARVSDIAEQPDDASKVDVLYLCGWRDVRDGAHGEVAALLGADGHLIVNSDWQSRQPVTVATALDEIFGHYRCDWYSGSDTEYFDADVDTTFSFVKRRVCQLGNELCRADQWGKRVDVIPF